MSMLTNKKRLALLVAAFAVTSLPLVAEAQRKSPLADAPAIRKRYELRSTRFEVGAGMGTTLNQPFFHTVMVNVKLGFHITDWLSLSGFAGFAVANMETGLQDRLVGSLDMNGNPLVPREPTPDGASGGIEKISNLFGAQLEGTFFTGKYSLFGKLFANYDFYVFAGGGGMTTAPAGSMLRECSAAPPTAENDADRYVCSSSGFKPGGTFGLGMHSFFNQFLALNVELRDMLNQLNPAGRDVNGDTQADENDLTWTHTVMVGANLVFYLPATARISP
jgi:outer membrane beta-barrel protein